MILYGSSIYPFVRKTAACTAEKGIALTLAPGGIGRCGARFGEAAAVAAQRDELPPLPDHLERELPAAGGLLVGDGLTLADSSVAPPSAGLAYIGTEATRWPRAAAWVTPVLARPSFAGMIESDRRTIDPALTRAT